MFVFDVRAGSPSSRKTNVANRAKSGLGVVLQHVHKEMGLFEGIVGGDVGVGFVCEPVAWEV